MGSEAVRSGSGGKAERAVHHCCSSKGQWWLLLCPFNKQGNCNSWDSYYCHSFSSLGNTSRISTDHIFESNKNKSLSDMPKSKMAIKGKFWIQSLVCLAPIPGHFPQSQNAVHYKTQGDFQKSLPIKDIILIDNINQKRNKRIFSLFFPHWLTY